MRDCGLCRGTGIVEMQRMDCDLGPGVHFEQCPVCNPPEPIRAWKVVLILAVVMLLAFITCGGGM